jgi:hypothetical protein
MDRADAARPAELHDPVAVHSLGVWVGRPEFLPVLNCELAMTDEDVEAACRGMYGKTWDGPPDKMPGPQMKEVWRAYAKRAIQAVDEHRAAQSVR